MTAGTSPNLQNHQYTAAGALSTLPFTAITSCRTIFRCKKEHTTLQEQFTAFENEQTALQEQNLTGQHHPAAAADQFFSPEITLHGCRSSLWKEILYINQVDAHPGTGETVPAPAATIAFIPGRIAAALFHTHLQWRFSYVPCFPFTCLLLP
jgi:hypothetical protein